MKCIKVAKLKFDPEKSKEEMIRRIFKDPVARTIWCCIKTGHITDQFFNEDVLLAAGRYNTLKINSNNKGHHFSEYYDFMKAVTGLCRRFGIVTIEDGYSSFSVTDSEYWVSVWKHIGPYGFGIKVEIQVPTLTHSSGD